MSLCVLGRKKKAAPPPPPQTAAPKPETSNVKLETASPVVASQPVENLPGMSSPYLRQSYDPTAEPRKLSNFFTSFNSILTLKRIKPSFKLQFKLPNRLKLRPITNCAKPFQDDSRSTRAIKGSFLSLPSLLPIFPR